MGQVSWERSARRADNLASFRMMTEVWPEPGKAARVSRLPASELIEEVEWLLSNGLQGWEVTQSLGRTAGTLARLLHRYGRHDLGSVFDRPVSGRGLLIAERRTA
jgi:hypothetical protein